MSLYRQPPAPERRVSKLPTRKFWDLVHGEHLERGEIIAAEVEAVGIEAIYDGPNPHGSWFHFDDFSQMSLEVCLGHYLQRGDRVRVWVSAQFEIVTPFTKSQNKVLYWCYGVETEAKMVGKGTYSASFYRRPPSVWDRLSASV